MLNERNYGHAPEWQGNECLSSLAYYLLSDTSAFQKDKCLGCGSISPSFI
jgi:hypothetical protein